MRWWFALSLATGCGRIGFDVASSPDAADATDATGDAAPAIDVCASVPAALYCTDFETDDLAPAARNGGAFVDAGFVGRGYSFSAPPSSADRISFRLSSPLVSGNLHVAARVQLDPTASVSTYVVIAQGLSATFDQKVSFDVAMGDRAQVISSVPPIAAEVGAVGSFPRGRWFCLELAIEIGDAGAMRGLVDGLLTVEALGVDTSPTVGIEYAEIGAFNGPNAGPITVVVDNFIVADRSIGCP